MKRPSGVIMAAGIAIVIGALEILGGIPYYGVDALVWTGVSEPLTGIVTNAAYALGSGLVLFGVLSIVFGIAALALQRWSWSTGVVLFGLQVIGLVALMFAAGVVTIGPAVLTALSALVVAYLYTDEVRVAFGHGERGLFMGGHRPTAA